MLFLWFFKNCELIKDSSLWRLNFILLVRDSIIITRSKCYTYTFGSHFDYKHWVRVSIKNLNFSFLGQLFKYCLLGLKACQLRLRVQKKMMRKRVKIKKKKKVKRKYRVEKMREKQNKGIFMLRQVMSRMLFIQTSLYLYSCTKRYVLILMNLTNLCPVLLFLCCRNMRTCFLTIYLVDCHLLEE